MKNNYTLKMKKISSIAFKFFLLTLFTGINSNAQVKKSSELSPSEYQKQKISGNIQNLFPSEFPKEKIIVSKNNKVKEVPKTGLVYTSNKNNRYKALTNGACNYPFAYEPPVLVPDTDLNGDIVTDTIVQFTNGQAPEYRNDDGSSPRLTLPFTFCFYGDTLNDSLFVNNNGNISFGAPYTTFSGQTFPNNQFVMIAPFWADVDTRDPGSNVVYMRRMPHYAIFKWHKVGYFPNQSDKLNSFMLVITDGTDVHVPNGLNVAFYYEDMQWTTGSASQGQNGFGGIPATVGANNGDNINYLQFGRFDQPGNAYDGPQNAFDGVDWLDDQTFVFSTCTNGNNVAPILTGITVCDTLSACLGDTLVYNIGFLGPEPLDSVSIHVIPPPGITTFSYTIDSITDPSTPVVQIVYVTTSLNSVDFQIWANDNGSPPLYSDTVTVTISGKEMTGSFTSVDGCESLQNGSITYLPSIGLAPYEISTDGGATFAQSLTANGLITNTYSVVASDDNGCTVDTSITITQFQGTAAVVGNDIITCLGNTVVLTGGPTVVGSTYSWTNASGVVVGTNQNLTLPTIIQSGLGDYTLAIITNNCPGASATINVDASSPAVTLVGGGVVGKNGTLCPPTAAQISFTFSGGNAPYKFSYTNGITTFNDSTQIGNNTYTVPVQNIVEGIYHVGQIINGDGCTKNNSNIDSIQIYGLTYDLTFDNTFATCGVPDGRTKVQVISNLPPTNNFTYIWTGANLTPDTITHSAVLSSIDSIFSIYGGEYNVQIKDLVGCKFKKSTIVPLKVGIVINVIPDTLEGVSPFRVYYTNLTTGDSIADFTFNFGDGTPEATTLNLADTLSHLYYADFDTTYTLIIKAKSEVLEECDVYDTLQIKVNVPVNVKTYNVLSLDGDKVNGMFRINPSGVLDIECLIFDRWGNKVHTYTNPGGRDWNGEIWGAEDKQAGTYYYVLNYNTRKDSKNTANTKTGFIQIIK